MIAYDSDKYLIAVIENIDARQTMIYVLYMQL